MNQLSPRIASCIELLHSCRTSCMFMASVACPEMGGEHARPQHLRLMMDCASVCLLAADLLTRKSQVHTRVCALCADICEICAEDCEQLGDMEACAALCRASADACHDMARLDHLEILDIASRTLPSA